MTLLVGLSQKKAQGTSLAVFLVPVGILGVMNYYKDNQVDFTKGSLIALGILTGAFFGSKIALDLDEVVMRRAFSVFLVAIGVYMFFKK